jgi:hypothetical protein
MKDFEVKANLAGGDGIFISEGQIKKAGKPGLLVVKKGNLTS